MLQVSDRVQTMLMRIEADLDRAESKIGDKLHLLDTDNDGVISKQELQDALKFLQVRLPGCGFLSLVVVSDCQDELGDVVLCSP